MSRERWEQKHAVRSAGSGPSPVGRVVTQRNPCWVATQPTPLWDAGTRALRSEVAAFALVVDAKDERAESLYRHHGFVVFGGQARQLVLPLATFARA